MTTIVLNTFDVREYRIGSYVRGMAEAFNLRGKNARNYYFHESGEQADVTAIQNDWEAVGEDLTLAFDSVASK